MSIQPTYRYSEEVPAAAASSSRTTTTDQKTHTIFRGASLPTYSGSDSSLSTTLANSRPRKVSSDSSVGQCSESGRDAAWGRMFSFAKKPQDIELFGEGTLLQERVEAAASSSISRVRRTSSKRSSKNSVQPQTENVQATLSITKALFEGYQNEKAHRNSAFEELVKWLESHPERGSERLLRCMREPELKEISHICDWANEVSGLSLAKCSVKDVCNYGRRNPKLLGQAGASRAQLRRWHKQFVGINVGLKKNMSAVLTYFASLKLIDPALPDIFAKDLSAPNSDGETGSCHWKLDFKTICELGKVEVQQQLSEHSIQESCTFLLLKTYIETNREVQKESGPRIAPVSPITDGMIQAVLDDLVESKSSFLWRCFDEVLFRSGYDTPEVVLGVLLEEKGDFLKVVMAIIRAEDSDTTLLYENKGFSLGSRILYQYSLNNFSQLLKNAASKEQRQNYEPVLKRIYGQNAEDAQRNSDITSAYIEKKDLETNHPEIRTLLVTVIFLAKDAPSPRSSSEKKELSQEAKREPGPWDLSFAVSRKRECIQPVRREKKLSGAIRGVSLTPRSLSRSLSRSSSRSLAEMGPIKLTGTESISEQFMLETFTLVHRDPIDQSNWHEDLCSFAFSAPCHMEALCTYYNILREIPPRKENHPSEVFIQDILKWHKARSETSPLDLISRLGTFEGDRSGKIKCNDTLAFQLFRVWLTDFLDETLSKRTIVDERVIQLLSEQESVVPWLCYEELSRSLEISDIYVDIMFLYESKGPVELLSLLTRLISIEDHSSSQLSTHYQKEIGGSRLLEKFLNRFFDCFIREVVIKTGEELAEGDRLRKEAVTFEACQYNALLKRILTGDKKVVERTLSDIYEFVKTEYSESPLVIYQVTSTFIRLEKESIFKDIEISVSGKLFVFCCGKNQKERFFHYLATEPAGARIALRFFYTFKRVGLKNDASNQNEKALIPVQQPFTLEFAAYTKANDIELETIAFYLEQEFDPNDFSHFRGASIAKGLWLMHCNHYLENYLPKLGEKLNGILEKHFPENLASAGQTSSDSETDFAGKNLLFCMQEVLEAICVEGEEKDLYLPEQTKKGVERIAHTLVGSEKVQTFCNRNNKELIPYVRQLTVTFLFLRVINPYLSLRVFNIDMSAPPTDLSKLLTLIATILGNLSNNSLKGACPKAMLRKGELKMMNDFLDEVTNLPLMGPKPQLTQFKSARGGGRRVRSTSCKTGSHRLKREE